jgi:hypothetical protein
MPSSTANPTYTISAREFAERYQIGVKKVLSWLNRGILTGVNVGMGQKTKRWRIREMDIERFEAAHGNQAHERPRRRPRRKKESRPKGYVEFFPER